jgi:hypothetical protein
MRIEPQFDPIFDRGEQRADDRARPERAAFAFDGWSYQPIASQDVRRATRHRPTR